MAIPTLPSYPLLLWNGLCEREDEKTRPEQQEPEPEPQSELEIQRGKDKQLTSDLRKAHMNLLATFEKLKKDYSSRSTYH